MLKLWDHGWNTFCGFLLLFFWVFFLVLVLGFIVVVILFCFGFGFVKTGFLCVAQALLESTL